VTEDLGRSVGLFPFSSPPIGASTLRRLSTSWHQKVAALSIAKSGLPTINQHHTTAIPTTAQATAFTPTLRHHPSREYQKLHIPLGALHQESLRPTLSWVFRRERASLRKPSASLVCLASYLDKPLLTCSGQRDARLYATTRPRCYLPCKR
jgi:hypothetical protein